MFIFIYGSTKWWLARMETSRATSDLHEFKGNPSNESPQFAKFTAAWSLNPQKSRFGDIFGKSSLFLPSPFFSQTFTANSAHWCRAPRWSNWWPPSPGGAPSSWPGKIGRGEKSPMSHPRFGNYWIFLVLMGHFAICLSVNIGTADGVILRYVWQISALGINLDMDHGSWKWLIYWST